MPLDPSIPLSIRPAEFTPPAQNIATLMAIRGQISELALRQQQSEVARQNALDIEQQRVQRERTNESQIKLAKVASDPENQKKFAAGDFSPAYSANITSDVLDPFITTHQEAAVKAQSLRTGQAGFYAQGRSRLGDILEGLDPNDDAKAAEQFNSAKAALGEEHPELAQTLPNIAPGPGFRQQLTDLATTNGLYHGMLEHKAALDKTAADTAKAASEGKRADVEVGMDQLKLDLMKNGADPQVLAVSVAKLIDPKLHPQAYQDAMAAAQLASKTGDMKQVADAVQGIYDKQIGSVQAQANLMPGEIKKATAIASAEVPIHVGEQIAVQKGLAALAPAAFSGIVNAPERDAVMKDAAAARTEYGNVLNDTNKVLDTIAAEKAGNKVAGSALTVDQAHALINNGRQLGTVLHQVSSGSGNLMDKIEGRLKGLGGTDHIPSDIVKDIGAFTVITQQAGQRKYQNDLDNLKMRGADITKIPPPSIAPGNPSGHQVGDTVRVNGKDIKIKVIYPDGSFD